MTKRQAAVLAFIRDFIVERQRPPSWREMMAHFGWRSTGAACQYVDALVRAGELVKEGGHVRVARARLAWVESDESRWPSRRRRWGT